MVVSIIGTWLVGSMAIIGIGFWLCYLIATVGRPKPPKPPMPAAPPAPPAPKPAQPQSPTYIRKWGIHRRAWVISEKAQWQAEFDRIGR